MSVAHPRAQALRSTSRAAAPYEAALRVLLPPREQGLLLAACLREREAAARAWSDFIAEVPDLKAYFEANHTGLKGMLPFIETSLARNGIDAGKAFHTYARVALVREELRSKIYAQILGAVLAALDAAEIAVVLIKGGTQSATVYPQPSMRHNHAIDLLVDAAQMADASEVLSQAQFTPFAVNCGAKYHQDFRHSSGLALGLHARLLWLPHFEMPLEDIATRTRSIRIGDRAVRVMSAEDSLVHVCGHAVYSRSRANLRWACDAFYLLQRNPALNWSVMIDTAARSGVALPLLVMLRWVSETLGASIPNERLAAIEERCRTIDAISAEGLYAALLHTTFSRARVFRAFNTNWRAQCGFLKFSVFPSVRFMRWKHNIDRGWTLPLYYADRPRRLVLRLATRVAHAISARGTIYDTDVSAKEGAA